MNISIVNDYLTAINAANVDKICSLITPDHVFTDSQNNRMTGSDNMRRAWAGYFALFPDYHIEIQETFVNENVICMLGYASGTYQNRKDSENSNSWRIPAAWKAILKDNKISHWQVYADNMVVKEIIDRNL